MKQEHDFDAVIMAVVDELKRNNNKAAGDWLDQFGSTMRGLGFPEDISKAGVAELTRAAYDGVLSFKVIVHSDWRSPDYRTRGDYDYAVQRASAQIGSARIFHVRSHNTRSGEG